MQLYGKNQCRENLTTDYLNCSFNFLGRLLTTNS